MQKLQAPFPYFGGKSRIADVVWDRFGNVPNYVEPFFGSGAVLLSRPHEPHYETVNDIDGMICNFWRAIKYDPKGVASYADWPSIENDLHARHKWLISQKASLAESLERDPEFYDVKIAGWWVWGMSIWIGGQFCDKAQRKRVQLNKLQGIKKFSNDSTDAWFVELSERLKNIRVCCGDWKRVSGYSATTAMGLTGMFLDPPYGEKANRKKKLYTYDSCTVYQECLYYCKENGYNPLFRIALCGYVGEYEELANYGWQAYRWKSHGMESAERGIENRSKETVWFSPHCLDDRQGTMF